MRTRRVPRRTDISIETARQNPDAVVDEANRQIAKIKENAERWVAMWENNCRELVAENESLREQLRQAVKEIQKLKRKRNQPRGNESE